MKPSLSYGLSPKIIADLQDIFHRFDRVQKVLLYGSRALGREKPGSDIDLTIVAPQMDLTELLKIENEIEDLMLPYKVDLSLLHHIDSDALKDHIHRAGIEFYKKGP